MWCEFKTFKVNMQQNEKKYIEIRLQEIHRTKYTKWSRVLNSHCSWMSLNFQGTQIEPLESGLSNHWRMLPETRSDLSNESQKRHDHYTTSTCLITVESHLGEGPPWVQVNTTGIPQHSHTAIWPDIPHPLHPLHPRSSIHIYPQFIQDWCENTWQNNNAKTSQDSIYLSHASTNQHNPFTATFCTSTS